MKSGHVLETICLFIEKSKSANVISMRSEERYLLRGVDIMKILPLTILVIFMTKSNHLYCCQSNPLIYSPTHSSFPTLRLHISLLLRIHLTPLAFSFYSSSFSSLIFLLFFPLSPPSLSSFSLPGKWGIYQWIKGAWASRQDPLLRKTFTPLDTLNPHRSQVL